MRREYLLVESMKLKLIRKYLGPEYTIGDLYIEDKLYCNTLEDVNRDTNRNGIFDGSEKKIAGDTCIPFGTYKIVVDVSPKFGRELPRLLNVPSFSGILIHRGNTTKDTAGCILVGENTVKGKVLNSTIYEVDLTKKIKEAISKGEKVTIQIV